MAQKIPATVITGFLGAGKTSLIRHLLASANGRRIGLIINEFGDLGVDGEILKGCGIEGCADDDIIELANGCICCTVADDFVPTIEMLLNRADPVDHIVIETSGLALPKPLVKAFNWPEIRTRVTVDGVVAVVDAPAVADGLFAADPVTVHALRLADPALDHDSPLHELFEEQLACADLVVVNKTDLINDEQKIAVAGLVSDQLRPGVKQISAVNGGVDAAVLLGLGAAAEDDLDSRRSHIDENGEHDHDDFVSFVLSLGQIAEPALLVAALQDLVVNQPVLRVKGYVAVVGKPMRLLLQGVGDRFDHYYEQPWGAHQQPATRLVVIGANSLQLADVEAALAEFRAAA